AIGRTAMHLPQTSMETRAGGAHSHAQQGAPDMTSHQLVPNVTIHAHACGEGGIFVNAYLIESRAGVVAVDATLSESESKALRKELEAIGKPLLAVLVTHPH